MQRAHLPPLSLLVLWRGLVAQSLGSAALLQFWALDYPNNPFALCLFYFLAGRSYMTLGFVCTGFSTLKYWVPWFYFLSPIAEGPKVA